MHPNQIQDWKKKLVADAEHVFGAGAVEAEHSAQETQQLHAKIFGTTISDTRTLVRHISLHPVAIVARPQRQGRRGAQRPGGPGR